MTSQVVRVSKLLLTQGYGYFLINPLAGPMKPAALATGEFSVVRQLIENPGRSFQVCPIGSQVDTLYD
jgi:hypothetical protein